MAAAEPLRKEFFALPDVKKFTEMQRNFNVITDIALRANSGEAGIGTGVNDITLVYNFFKTLDPASVVRESEFATVGQKMGLPSQITAAFQSVSGGGFLPPAGAGGTNLVDQIKATTDARTLLDLGTNYETWDNATKAAYVARLNQISAGVR